MGFSSYAKAHVGAVRPFFLDTPLHTINRFGSEHIESRFSRVTASIYRLTSLKDMIQDRDLIFREGRTVQRKNEVRYDLLASPNDLVDTGSPGQFVTSNNRGGTPNLISIIIGGGVIKPTVENSNVLHWSSSVEPRHELSVNFSPTEKVLIAGGVEVNRGCRANGSERWFSFIDSLENLGTSTDYWKFTEFQAGVPIIGQQFAGGQLQFSKTWT